MTMPENVAGDLRTGKNKKETTKDIKRAFRYKNNFKVKPSDSEEVVSKNHPRDAESKALPSSASVPISQPKGKKGSKSSKQEDPNSPLKISPERGDFSNNTTAAQLPPSVNSKDSLPANKQIEVDVKLHPSRIRKTKHYFQKKGGRAKIQKVDPTQQSEVLPQREAVAIEVTTNEEKSPEKTLKKKKKKKASLTPAVKQENFDANDKSSECIEEPLISAEISSVVPIDKPKDPLPKSKAQKKHRHGKKAKAHHEDNEASTDKVIESLEKLSCASPIKDADKESSASAKKNLPPTPKQDKIKKKRNKKHVKKSNHGDPLKTLETMSKLEPVNSAIVSLDDEDDRDEKSSQEKASQNEVVVINEGIDKRDLNIDVKEQRGGKIERPNVSPITVGSSVVAFGEEMPPTMLGASKLSHLSQQEDKGQQTPPAAPITESSQSPIHHVYTNAAGAAILRTIGNAGSCASSLSSSVPLMNMSVSPSYLDSAPQPQHMPQKMHPHVSPYGNVMHPIPLEFNERPYSYAEAGWMFMPILPEGYCHPSTVPYPFSKERYTTVSPASMYQQQYFPQVPGSPSEYSNEGMIYAANYGQWRPQFSYQTAPPQSDGQNYHHNLNVEAPEFNPNRMRLQ
mmetsp:Transcript_19372/g.27610  ORF Transcript_19372/g.27610 Transcript_19372/m.27610 type:complete len:624 (+) Transcript_19372:120-1991(+)